METATSTGGWQWMADPVALATLCLIVGVPLALLLSWALLARYRSAVRRSMLETSGASPRTAEPPPLPRATPPPELSWIDSPADAGDEQPELLTRARRARLRLAWSVALAGLAHTLVATFLLLEASDIDLSLRRFTALWLVLAWPIVPSASVVAVGDRRLRLAAPVLFLLASWVLLPVTAREFAFLAAWLGGVPMLLALAASSRRFRAAAPATLFATIAAIIVGNIALSLVYTIVLSAGSLPVELSLIAVGVLTVGGAWLGGVAFLRHLAKRYRAKRTSDQLQLLSLWWVLYSIWIVMLLATGWSWGGLAGVLPLLIWFAVLRWCLRHARSAAGDAPRRLLLLRVFGHRSRSERLLENLGRLWRYVGTVELIAGRDLATTNLEPHELLDFIGGRLGRQFVSGPEDLERRVGRRDEAPDPDGRFRVQEYFCHDDTWRPTLRRLAADASAVLMDLRGFSSANRGCAWELGQLLAYVPLSRILLLVDESTDRPLLDRILHMEWSRLPLGSENEHDPSPTLLVLTADANTTRSAHRVLAALGHIAA